VFEAAKGGSGVLCLRVGGAGRKGKEEVEACAGSMQFLLCLSRAPGEEGECARGSGTLLCLFEWVRVGECRGEWALRPGRSVGEAPLPML